MPDLDQVRSVKEKIKEQLAGNEGVRGVGIGGTGSDYLVKVNLAHDDVLPVDQRLPELDGVEVRYDVVGEVRALDPDEPEQPAPP